MKRVSTLRVMSLSRMDRERPQPQECVKPTGSGDHDGNWRSPCDRDMSIYLDFWCSYKGG